MFTDILPHLEFCKDYKHGCGSPNGSRPRWFRNYLAYLVTIELTGPADEYGMLRCPIATNRDGSPILFLPTDKNDGDVDRVIEGEEHYVFGNYAYVSRAGHLNRGHSEYSAGYIAAVIEASRRVAKNMPTEPDAARWWSDMPKVRPDDNKVIMSHNSIII